MIVHQVFFWLKNPASAADRATLIEGVKSLGQIEGVHHLVVGVPAATEPRPVIDSSYDVSELMYFDSLEAQEAYQNHPLHQQFIRDCGPLWQKVLVYDFEAV